MAILNLSWRRWKIQTGLACSILLCAGTAVLWGEISKEYQVKAVFLLNFTQFVQWPAGTFSSPEDPLTIGILGADPFGQYLDGIVQGEKVDSHPLVVRRYSRVEDAEDCQILFVSGSESKRVETILAVLNGKRILTISDIDGFASKGGIIRFVVEGNKIRFRINLEAAKKAQLKISSKLLRLAEIARTERN